MKNSLSIICLLFLCAVPPAVAKDVPENPVKTLQGFGQREILCTIDFPVNSTQLTPTARDIINQHLPYIKTLDIESKLIRIEGFASPDGTREVNYRLSLERAMAVGSFLRNEHGVLLEHYITGFGPKKESGISASGTRSVQLVIYDNPWGQDNIPVELTKGER